MVKGISRQVIVVHSPDPKLFEQAIFILKDDAVGQGVTDEVLLREANKALRNSPAEKKRFYGPVWACGGALMTAVLWLLISLL
jgi:hypothetical protein